MSYGMAGRSAESSGTPSCTHPQRPVSLEIGPQTQTPTLGGGGGLYPPPPHTPRTFGGLYAACPPLLRGPNPMPHRS